MVVSVFGVLGFFENVMKAMGRIPRETHWHVRALTVQPVLRSPRSPEAHGDRDSKVKATAERSILDSHGQA